MMASIKRTYYPLAAGYALACGMRASVYPSKKHTRAQSFISIISSVLLNFIDTNTNS